MKLSTLFKFFSIIAVATQSAYAGTNKFTILDQDNTETNCFESAVRGESVCHVNLIDLEKPTQVSTIGYLSFFNARRSICIATDISKVHLHQDKNNENDFYAVPVGTAVPENTEPCALADESREPNFDPTQEDEMNSEDIPTTVSPPLLAELDEYEPTRTRAGYW